MGPEVCALAAPAAGAAGPGDRLAATGGGFLVAGLVLLGAGLVARLLGVRRAAVLAIGGLVVAAGLVPPAPASAQAAQGVGCVLAGADRTNIAPFTVGHPNATDVDPLSNAAASNPDGLPGGLWDQIAGGLGGPTSEGQVTFSGIWGELFTDDNGNRRHDEGESFEDDAVNSAIDPLSSPNHYDGVYLGGFGNDRIPRGAFDPIWVRTVFVRDPVSGKSVAHAVLDFIGYFSDRVPKIVERAKAIEPAFTADAVVVGHTHSHQTPDMVGLWGPMVSELPSDGTYPKYERYVEEKVAQSLVNAFRSARPARFRAGMIRAAERFTTARGTDETLAGLQTKGNCRTPWFFDDEMRAFQLEGLDGRTIATLANWGMHIESMEDGNQYLSSDNPATAREEMERTLGGVAVFTQGAQGSVEVVGDSCTRRWRRDTFDGETFPVDAEDGRPLAFTPKEGTEEWAEPTQARDRTYAMGRVLGNAAVAALRRAPWDEHPQVDVLPPVETFFPANNGALLAVSAAGTIDKPAYTAVEHEPLTAAELSDLLDLGASAPSGFDVKTTLFAWRVGSASFVTAPGELFPELYYGVTDVNRAVPKGDYVQVNPAALACSGRPFAYSDDPAAAGAHTGRPYEPSIRQAQIERFGARTNFLLGYSPDLLGYIVPGYDFDWYAAPGVEGTGVGALEGEAPDPCEASVPDLAFPDVRYGVHYHETNSASSVLAPGISCGIIDLLRGPTATAGNPACEEYRTWRTATFTHLGLGPVPDPSAGPFPVAHY